MNFLITVKLNKIIPLKCNACNTLQSSYSAMPPKLFVQRILVPIYGSLNI